jgi:hypothetical protein
MRGTCDVALHIDHQEMADRILAALEGLLSEERVARIVAKAEALIQAALDQGDMKLDRERLRAVDRKLRRKAVLFEEEDDEVAAARIHREMRPLRAERKALRERLAAAESCGLDCDAIRAELEKLALDVRTNATESAEAAREALLALIAEDEYGKRRLDVIEDPEAPGGYRIEGTLRMPIALETGNADRKATSGRRLTRLVAWAGFGTKSAPAFPRLTLPVEGVVGVATA